MTELLVTLQAALGLAPASVRQTGQGALPSAFAVTDLACASIAAAGQRSASTGAWPRSGSPVQSARKAGACPLPGTRLLGITPAAMAGFACTPTRPTTAPPPNGCWAR